MEITLEALTRTANEKNPVPVVIPSAWLETETAMKAGQIEVVVCSASSEVFGSDLAVRFNTVSNGQSTLLPAALPVKVLDPLVVSAPRLGKTEGLRLNGISLE